LLCRHSCHLSHSSSPLLWWFFSSLMNYLLGMASNCDPSNLCLLCS
jgi:hypothetical protein